MVRVKNRYVVVRIVLHNSIEGQCTFTDKQIAKNIMTNVQKYYGDLGAGTVEHGFAVKYCNDVTRIAVIRIRHRAHRYVTSILPLITVIGDHRAKYQILQVGATIKKCNIFIVRYQKYCLNKIAGGIESTKERQDFIKNIMNFDLE